MKVKNPLLHFRVLLFTWRGRGYSAQLIQVGFRSVGEKSPAESVVPLKTRRI